MKTIKIAHLYYDLMNLYGEIGNILALKYHLEQQNVKVKIDNLSIEDKIDFSLYDFFYIGSGSDEDSNLCLENLKKYKNDIKNALKEGRFFLVTGNALDFFGKTVIIENKKLKGLELFSYESEKIPFRIVGEQKMKHSKLEEDIVGFQNRSSILKNMEETPLFTVNEGTGYIPKAKEEGITKNHFFGTYLLGPILIRNPHFTEYLIKELLKWKQLPYKPFTDDWEILAHNE